MRNRRTRECGQALAGCSLQGYGIFRPTTTCLPLRRAVELEKRRDGQMEIQVGEMTGKKSLGQDQNKSFLLALSSQKGLGT